MTKLSHIREDWQIYNQLIPQDKEMFTQPQTTSNPEQWRTIVYLSTGSLELFPLGSQLAQDLHAYLLVLGRHPLSPGHTLARSVQHICAKHHLLSLSILKSLEISSFVAYFNKDMSI